MMSFDTAELLPRPFGAYLLLHNFARGGMGEVYVAKSGGIAGLERICVVKKLRPELTGDREYVTRFVDEARVVVTLNHANICSVFDVGRVATPGAAASDEYYLAMEYVAGVDLRTLHDRCRQQGQNPDAAVVVHLVCEVLKALDYAHRRRHPVTGEPLQLVHRDVSPQNVLVSYEGEVKLIDFGLAASRLKVERTEPNVVMGKLAYMPPEQARGDPVDGRADLFACAVMLYELLANERYYEGLSSSEIWQVAGRGTFTPPGWSRIDVDLQPTLARALHPDPQRRLASCGELRELLLQWGASRGIAGAERRVRVLMEQAFSDDIAQERALMARFGGVTIASFRTEHAPDRARAESLTGHVVGDGPTVMDAVRPPDRSTEEAPQTDPRAEVDVLDTHLDPPADANASEKPSARTTAVHASRDDDVRVATSANAPPRPSSSRVGSERLSKRRTILAVGFVVLGLLAWWGMSQGEPLVATQPSTESTEELSTTTPLVAPPIPARDAARPRVSESVTERPASAPGTSTRATRVVSPSRRPRPRGGDAPSSSLPLSPPPSPLPKLAPRPARGPVSPEAFETLVRANPRCVRALLQQRTRLPAERFFAVYADDIRACGFEVSISIP